MAIPRRHAGVLLDAFADTSPPRWMPPDAAMERTLESLVALLPRPLPTGNPYAEQSLAGVLLRLGSYEDAAHYAAESFRRSASPISALAVARAAAALGDRDTALGWLRAAEGVSNPEWISQALQHAPELARLAGGPAAAGDFGSRQPSTTCAASFFGAIRQYEVRISSSISGQSGATAVRSITTQPPRAR